MSSPMSDPSTGESSEDLSAKQTLLTDMGRYEIIIFILIFFVRSFKQARGLPLFLWNRSGSTYRFGMLPM